MARQVLENGVILPAEYSDDWYDDMTSNLTKLDDVIGSDSEKLSSSDVGAAALSNDYNDLDNLPTIPTVNDATLTIQKNGVDVQTFTANASSNVTCNITVPTKTSDLTNDSDFVDTSNSAVSSGITSAKVTSYDTHIADTDIHVTTADKNRWNNQTYVFRYSSTALTASSTNSNALLDNADNLKVGDKVIDSSGVLFSITAIDTANSTFTIGTALIDLAQDSDVVHKSGDETVSGIKSFSDDTYIKSLNFTNEVPSQSSSSSSIMPLVTTVTYTDQTASKVARINLRITASGDKSLYPHENNQYALGLTSRKWSEIHGVTYYYGSSDTEFSQKFVTTDTAQTISGNKTFSSDLYVANTDTTANTPNLNLRNYKADRGTTDTAVQTITFLDKNAKALTLIESRRISNGNTATNILCYNNDANNDTVSGGVAIIKSKTDTNFAPNADNAVTCGRALAKWSDVQTYKVNALEPSSLSLPSDRSARIDISSYFTNTGTGDKNTYTVPANGYIYMDVNDCVSLYMFSQTTGNLSNYGNSICRNAVGRVMGFLPVRKDDVFTSQWYTSATNVTLASAFFIPCQGNV